MNKEHEIYFRCCYKTKSMATMNCEMKKENRQGQYFLPILPSFIFSWLLPHPFRTLLTSKDFMTRQNLITSSPEVKIMIRFEHEVLTVAYTYVFVLL